MPKAVLKNGEIRLIEPLPPQWVEGQELWVEEAANGHLSDDSTWFQALEALCAAGDLEEDAKLETALNEAHKQAKELMRLKMGLL
jgi:hypothetical protein